MKNKALIAGILIAIFNGLLFVPGFEAYGIYLVAAALALALWLVLKAMTVADYIPAIEEEKVSTPVQAHEPVVVPPAPKNAAEAEVIAVISTLQSKGRLVDFLMDDISKYSDAQVGAAARVVHQGCKSAFDEMITVEPVAREAEGSVVTVPEHAVDSYRISGSASGGSEQKGKLVHKGWKASRVNLPRVIKSEEGKLPVIAPAQIEVK
ncbi:DUF2760 domain-containing protein [Pelagicoccus sp. SDUM812002]|uniref:DUF2760 domain-containing protein n=1 Tax=Pelagicoccus sp. SDUM812002 TaxID=3041266 RepID=UPI0028103DA7|nr:DUF2760 domain-containing protein [Pelagicoccus sp. SDUM812002]MDQ8187241.1 DUF2760 domain-containing protein [Pelagicoccus sp. SDUM812002]